MPASAHRTDHPDLSSAAKVAFPANSAYHAGKWGLEGFTEAVAQEVASSVSG